jgi:hypothetical protein
LLPKQKGVNPMKKTIATLILILLVFVLAACDSTTIEQANPITSSDAADSNDVGSSNTRNSSQDGEFSLPGGTKMMLGTVLLEETNYAVDAEQAAQLLPLWKALRSFGESETTAQAEIDAVISQIEETMNDEQINAIDYMELTMQDMGTVAELLGVEMGGFGGNVGEITPEMQATREAMRESGQSPGGGPGGGMGLGGGQGPGGGFGGEEMDPNARATAIAERGGTRGARTGINAFLLDAVIEFLETKMQ